MVLASVVLQFQANYPRLRSQLMLEMNGSNECFCLQCVVPACVLLSSRSAKQVARHGWAVPYSVYGVGW